MGLLDRQEQSTHKSIWPNVWHVTVSNNEIYILTNHDYPKLLISEFRESTKSNVIFFQIRRDAPKLQSKFIGNVPVSLIMISPQLNSLAQHKLSLDEHPPSWKSGQILTQARTRNVFLLGFWKLVPDTTEAETEGKSKWNPHMPLAGLPEQPGSSFDLTWLLIPYWSPVGILLACFHEPEQLSLARTSSTGPWFVHIHNRVIWKEFPLLYWWCQEH